MFPKLTGGCLLETGISKKNMKKKKKITSFQGIFRPRLEHGHLLEFLGYSKFSLKK